MTILITSPVFADHLTGQHPEKRERSLELNRAMTPYVERTQAIKPTPLDETILAKVHAPEQIAIVKNLCAAGGGAIDADTVVSAKSLVVAETAVSACVDATSAILSGVDTNALCLVRPPGHHATNKQSMGFCLFNNVAVAAKIALERFSLGRVLIVDWDVHHGNGTQDIFYADEQVYYFSIHRYPFYPGTGSEAETGFGFGLGTTFNMPMTYGTSRGAYLSAFRHGMEKAADAHKPELIIISAGFDAHIDDPIGSLGLATEDFAEMTQIVMEVAKGHCQGRVLSCLEGGYNLRALCDSVEQHLQVMLEYSSDSSPPTNLA